MAVLRRINELEVQGALPERREAAKSRKKLVKEVQNLTADSNVASNTKVDWLQNKLLELVCLFSASNRPRLNVIGGHALIFSALTTGQHPG